MIRSMGSVDELDVVMLQRPVVVVARAARACSGTDNPVSARPAVPRRRRARRGTLSTYLLSARPRRGSSARRCGVVVLKLPDPPARRGAQPRGSRGNAPILLRCKCRSSFGTIHGGVRWKTVSCVGDLGELGHDLHPAGPRTDHRHASCPPSRCWCPTARCASACRAKSATPSMSGSLGIAEQPDGADHDIARSTSFRRPASMAPAPSAVSRIPAMPAHRGAEHQVAAQVEVVGDRLQVGQDFGLPGVGAAPGLLGANENEYRWLWMSQAAPG